MKKSTRSARFGVLGTLAALTISTSAIAATTVRITQNSPNWAPLDTRVGGDVEFTILYGAPGGLGSSSLELTTIDDNASKADYFTFDHMGTPLAAVTDLSYYTFQPAGQVAVADASFQLQIDVDGTIGGGGFTTLVFEPYWNGVISSSQWQQWDVDTGNFWSSRTVTVGTCALVAGAGGPPFYTLAELKAICPQAVVIGVGVNVGTFNPDYTVATDGVRFNDIIYNFEIGHTPTTTGDCKKGGWKDFDDPSFRNQGQCVSWVDDNVD